MDESIIPQSRDLFFERKAAARSIRTKILLKKEGIVPLLLNLRDMCLGLVDDETAGELKELDYNAYMEWEFRFEGGKTAGANCIVGLEEKEGFIHEVIRSLYFKVSYYHGRYSYLGRGACCHICGGAMSSCEVEPCGPLFNAAYLFRSKETCYECRDLEWGRDGLRYGFM